MGLNFLLQIQTVPSANPAADISVWGIISESNGGIGWLVNLGILAIFGFGIFVFAERYLTLHRASREDSDFLDKIRGFLLDGNIDAAKKFCSNSEGPSARLFEKGIERLGKPLDHIALAIENTSRVEISRLKRRIHFLAIAGAASPMLGLLGTASGLIKYFTPDHGTDVQAMASVMPAAEGLFIGVIALLGYFYLKTKLAKIIYTMETNTVEFMDILN